MKRRVSCLLLSLAALAVLASASTLPAFAVEEVYDPRTLEIARQLACPVCEGQTVADSQSRMAAEMRQAIEAQVQAGRTDAEIFDFFIARYQQEVLVNPPREGINLGLWWAPVIAGLIGLGVVVLYLRDSVRLGARRTVVEQRPDDELERIAEQVLHDRQRSSQQQPGDAPAESP